MIDKRPVLIHWWKIVISIIKKVMGLSKKEDICLANIFLSPVFILVTILPCFLSTPSLPLVVVQLEETVWNPKSLSFSPLNGCLSWNVSLTKTFTAVETAPRAEQTHPKTIYA